MEEKLSGVHLSLTEVEWRILQVLLPVGALSGRRCRALSNDPARQAPRARSWPIMAERSQKEQCFQSGQDADLAAGARPFDTEAWRPILQLVGRLLSRPIRAPCD